MEVLVVFLASLLAVADCSPLPPDLPFLTPSTYNLQNGPISNPCEEGQVLDDHGQCIVPEITLNTHIYFVPKDGGALPKVKHNIIFISLPEDQKPVGFRPPHQKNIIYFLRKKTQEEEPAVSEVPAPVNGKPEVYVLNYNDGENPILPTGGDLLSALANNAERLHGNVVNSDSGNSNSEVVQVDYNNQGVDGQELNGRVLNGNLGNQLPNGQQLNGRVLNGNLGNQLPNVQQLYSSPTSQ